MMDTKSPPKPQTATIAFSPENTSFLRRLKERLSTQETCFMRTPLFCVYQNREDVDADARMEIAEKAWPESIFLTEAEAEHYMKVVHYRLKNPFIYVHSPGEDSELHDLLRLIKELPL